MLGIGRSATGTTIIFINLCISQKLKSQSLFKGLAMPIFGEAPSPYDETVEKVTAETCTTENWTLILDICDRVIADQNKGVHSHSLLEVPNYATIIRLVMISFLKIGRYVILLYQTFP
ncbi:unnamed protein product [Brugia timori]|uniref:VHS domain-containing protein n=1 Tax=Brugia timori TaxID=42155 RepID=A0A0R3R052_9BILA|nr:unnamed protein product [Brugia timori]